MYSIRFVQQANQISKNNIPLLQLLDSIKSIKRIPDSTPDSSYNRIREIMKSLDDKSIDSMVKLAMKYNPMTRAIVGAIIEDLFDEERARVLRDTLMIIGFIVMMTGYLFGLVCTIIGAVIMFSCLIIVPNKKKK